MSLSSSNIFTDHGPDSILHVVQMARIYADSKTFVDMKVLSSPNQVQLKFDSLMARHNNDIPLGVLKAFVEENFTLEDQVRTVSFEVTVWIFCRLSLNGLIPNQGLFFHSPQYSQTICRH